MMARPSTLRPAATSGGTALLAALVVTGVLVLPADLSLIAAAAIGGGVLLGAAGVLTTRRSIAAQFAAAVALLGAVLTSAVWLLPLVTGVELVLTLVSGFLVAGWFLLALTVSGSATRDGILRVQSLLYRQLAALAAVALGAATLQAGSLSAVRSLFGALARGGVETVVTVGSTAPPLLCVVVAVALLFVRSAAVRAADIGLLDRDTGFFEGEVSIESLFRPLLLGVGGFIVVSGLLTAHRVVGGPVGLLTALAEMLAAVTSGSPVVVLGATGGLGLAVGLRVAVGLLALVQRTRVTTLGRRLVTLVPGLAAGVGITVVVGGATGVGGAVGRFVASQPVAAGVLETVGVGPLAVVGVLLLSLPLVAGLAAVGLAHEWRVIRGVQGVGALASACFLVAVLVGTPFTTGPLLTLVGVVAALLVWDSVAFGLRLAKDLGWTPPAVPNELTHSLASTGAGVVAVAIAVAGLGLMYRQPLPAIDEAVSIALAGGAALLLLTGIGRE